MLETIEQQIADTDLEAMIKLFPNAPYDPYSYQLAVYRIAAENISKYSHPFIIKAAVSAGKTTIISLLSSTIQRLKMPALILSRQGEIVEQDAAEMWAFGVKNSIYCASLKMKSVENRIIVGSEKTVFNALSGDLANYAPLIIMIDECQHVDVDDLITSELAVVKYKETITDPVTGEMIEVENERIGENYEEMIAVKRSQYTVVIRTLQERCRRIHGKNLRIIGLTGTDFRGVQPIINEDLETPGFWRSAVCDISTDYLVKFGAVVPTHFGDVGETHYDLSAFRSSGVDGEVDFSVEKLKQMQASIDEQRETTKAIMLDVYQRTLHRNSVLVTCAGKRHCEEAAAALPPGTTYCIITDATKDAKRREYLKDIKDGKIKFTFQIGCLTTGVNVPIWDTGVILRKIGSLTLLVQLIGRTMRKLKKEQIAAGIVKKDAMILDYSETMLELGELYFNPLLEQYTYEIATQTKEFKHCPVCQEMGKSGRNGEHARRCMTEHATNPARITGFPKGYLLKPYHKRRAKFPTERCEYFWKARVCEDVKDNRGVLIKRGCGAENDITARYCRKCSGTLIDPNENLSAKHYTDADYYDVVRFNIKPTTGQTSLIFEYILQDPKDGRSFRATEMFSPQSDNRIALKKWADAVKAHVPNAELAKSITGIRNTLSVMGYIQHFVSPNKATHRKGKGNRDILHKKVFPE